MFRYLKIAIIISVILCMSLFYFGIAPYYLIYIPISIFIAIAVYGAAFIQSQIFVPSIYKIKNNKICLSFDDGPSEHTIAILDILKKHQVKALFFCIGKNLEKHNSIAQRAFDEGHLLGNHTYSHAPLISLIPAEAYKDEIYKTNEILSKITGEKFHYFRPPYGVTNPNIAKALQNYPLPVIGWNVRSLDTVAKNEKELLNKIISKTQAGSLLLFHDTMPITVAILDELICHLKAKGFEFTTDLE